MRVGLNATCLNDRPSGAKQRFEGIYGALVERLPNVEFVLYEPADCRVGDWFSGAANVSAKRTPLPSEGRVAKFGYGLGYWPMALRSQRFDIFECFNQPLVRSRTGRTLTTVHDIRRIYSDWSYAERQLYTHSLRQTLARADTVITVSETMRSEILDFHPAAEVSVVYNGLDPMLFAAVTEPDMREARRKFGLPDEFVLTVGHFERRKNYLRLIDSIALLRQRGIICNLVIVGNDSGERRLVEAKVADCDLTRQVKILSGLSDLEVRCLYKLSALLVFPSSYEGFGIPILEAMAAGTPVILSDIPVFREITEGKGMYFPHDDSDAMAHAIESGLSSQSMRAQLIADGNRRVLDFSFDSLSAQVADLYTRVLS
jgi:glycosyltransferase involved in cell wall biosynthesis